MTDTSIREACEPIMDKDNVTFQRKVYEELLFWGEKTDDSKLKEKAIAKLAKLSEIDGISLVKYLRQNGEKFTMNWDFI